MTEQAKKNKKLRQQRNINHFVESTANLLEREGISAMTIRSIADSAGYSSASLYKYFDNVEQLVAFGAIRCMREFLGELNTINRYENPLEKYLLMIYISARHSFLHSNVFQAVMIKRQIEPGPYFERYYALYPDEQVDLHQDVYSSLFDESFTIRTDLILRQCASEGLLETEDIPDIVDFTNIIFEGFVSRRSTDLGRYNVDYLMAMLKRIFVSFNPDLAQCFEKIQADFVQ